MDFCGQFQGKMPLASRMQPGRNAGPEVAVDVLHLPNCTVAGLIDERGESIHHDLPLTKDRSADFLTESPSHS